jgi:triphosphoribosyl-dephospho-CoA synthase
MNGASPATVAALFEAACLAELQALKPGNVHVHGDGHGMTVADFAASAAAAAPHLAAAGRTVGERILGAVAATRAACGQNTNLGIVLLCAPLAAAAERGRALRASLEDTLARLDRHDAVLAYRAIRLASPGGLGRSDRHDVADEPAVTLLEAMREAAARDRIARQYANGFADVFEIGADRLQACRRAGWPEERAMSATFVAFLAAFPDGHVVRKHGDVVAQAVRAEGRELDRLMRAEPPPGDLHDRLLRLDRELKRRGINPGTSADLTVASHLAVGLAAATAAGSSSNHRNPQS